MRATNLTLLTDLYELTMMQGYFKNPSDQIVVFDAFYRRNPCDGGYAISCGLADVIEYIKNLHFSYDDIQYLKSLNIFEDDFLDYLAGFHFTGDIWGIPEGTVIFPREPMLKVIAPIMQAQLIETAVLNMLNHQSLIATKAARVCYAAKGDGVMEFGLRRAQGPDAGIYGARAAVIAGCVGTSNVLTGKMFDVPILGTHAHSWIMSFPSEYEAFKAYSKIYPNACTLLVDTYDVLESGVPNAIRVFREMKQEGIRLTKYGIRIDSGDLAYLSKKAYQMLCAAGFPDAIISASSDLDEYLITDLKAQGAMINSWGVGTNLITAKDNIPKIKLSENTEKVTNPGNKKIVRIYDKESGKIRADLICLVDETFSEDEDMIIFDPIETWKKTKLHAGTFTLKEIMVQVFKNGECIYNDPATTMEIRERCLREQDTMWDETRRLVNPHQMYVDLSDKLFKIKSELLEQMSMEQLK